MTTPSVTWMALIPVLVLTLGGLLLLTVSSLAKGRVDRGAYTLWTVVTGVVALLCAVPSWARVQGWEATGWWDPATTPAGPFSTLAGTFGVDGFSLLITMLVALAVIVVALVAGDYAEAEGIDGPELHVLLLLAGVGAVTMASANDLIVLFLGLETLSIASYVLAAIQLRRVESTEAGFKYFVLGAFSSAFFLYGVAMVYGGTGSTSLAGIRDYLAGNLLFGEQSILLLLGLGLLVIGFGFKVAAVPFHSWSPDTYDGAPSPVVAFMASVTKAAAFAGMIRVFVAAFGPLAADWRPVVSVLAVLSLVGGALAAVVQTNVKRLLAYSSISHAGFILLGVQAAGPEGVAAVVVYLVAYSLMVMGSFTVVTVVAGHGDADHAVSSYRGLGRTSPVVAGSFTLLLLAQAGAPFTAGFYAKFVAVRAAVESDATWLAVVAMLSATIAAYLYLRVVVTMWFNEADERRPLSPAPFGAKLAIAVCVAGTLAIGLFPDGLTRLADQGQPVLVRDDAPATGVLPGDLTLVPQDATTSSGG